MSHSFFSFLLFFSSLFSFAQNTFQKTFFHGGGFGYSTSQTADGGYISVGHTGSNMILLKTDINGNNLWAKIFTETFGVYAYSIKQTTDGGFIISGEIRNSTGIDGWGCLIKTDSLGDAVWIKKFTLFERLMSVEQTTDGGYVATGGKGGGLRFVKLDAAGNTTLSKNITFDNPNPLYFDDDTWGISIKQTTDGGYIVAALRGVGGAWGPTDFSLIKINNLGVVVWVKAYDNGYRDDWPVSVKQTPDGGYIITGWTNPLPQGLGDRNVLVIKTNSSGTVIWSKIFGGDYDDYPEGLLITNNGKYIIAGRTKSFACCVDKGFLLKLDYDGSILWSNTYCTPSFVGTEVMGAQLINDGGFLLTGVSFTTTSSSSNAFSLIKTDSVGAVNCGKDSVVMLFDTIAAITTPLVPIVVNDDFGVFTTLTSYSPISLSETTHCFSLGVAENSSNKKLKIQPNPFTTFTEIFFSLKKTETAIVEITDLSGKIVLLESGIFNSGENTFSWNGRNGSGQSCPSGVYFIKVKTKDLAFIGKILKTQ